MPQLNVGTVRGNSPNFEVSLDATSTLLMSSDLRVNNQSYVPIPSGSATTKPGAPDNGSIRYNTTTSRLEIYTGVEWKQI